MADTRTVSIRGGMFEIYLWSQGRGPALLYLHGSGGLLAWPGWLDSFSERSQVVAPQHPGFGRSTGLEHIDDFIDFALYYHDFIDAMGLRKPVVIGHSLGGNIAAEMAALCSDNIGKLVLIAPTGLWSDEHPTADFFIMPDEEALKLAWHDSDAALKKGLIPVPKTDEEKKVMSLERTRALAAAGKFLWPIPDKGLKKRIHRIKAPTLLLWGASDRIVPPIYGRLFQERIPGSRLVVIPEAGHSPMLEQPERFLAAVKQFLKE